MYQLWKENPENAEKSMDEFVTEIEKGQRPAENIQVAKLATDSPLGRTSKHLPSTGSAFGFASFAGMSLLLVGAGMAKKKAETEQ